MKRRLERTELVTVTMEPEGSKACISATKLATNCVESAGIAPETVCRHHHRNKWAQKRVSKEVAPSKNQKTIVYDTCMH